MPNYTYLKLKMPGLKGVITVEGSFEQAYYCEQDYVTQVVALVAPSAPDGPSCDTRRVPMEEVTKTTAVLDRSTIGEADKTSGGSGGSAGPSILALSAPEGADPIKVSFDLSP